MTHRMGATPSSLGWRLSVLLTGLLLGCTSSEKARSGGEEAPVMDGSPEHTDTATDPDLCSVDAVFERNGCLACHGTNAELSGGGLNFTADRLEESLVGVTSRSPGCSEAVLVNADDPEASVLLHTVAADHYAGALDAECSPMTMPLGGTSTMSREDVDCIEQWIHDLDAPETEPPDVTFPAPALTVLTRVKYLLDGGALTADELALGSDSDGELSAEGLEALVDDWMSGDRFRAKRRQFLQLHLQQTPSDGNYYNQFRNTRTNSLTPIREALNESLIRTAERIIDDGEDFRSIVTTNTWEMTTTTLLALKMADNPMVLKPNGVWPKNHGINDIRYVTNDDHALYDREADSEDWRTVTLVHTPDSTDMMTEEEMLDPDNAERLRAIPDGGSIVLRTPRVGFFSSPAFFQTWLTNRDNDFRVTINQAMIVATGMTFSPGDSTPLTGDGAAVDADLFPAESTCYGCHKNLDAMRPAFLADYDNINTRHTVPETALPQAGFSFQGQSVEVNSLQDWAEALAAHPNFATAWVLKLCQWASSTECSATDPDVLALADDFAASGHDLTQLFAAFFTSPLVTMTSDREDSPAPGAQVSVARLGHYCHALRSRLSDARAAQGHTNLLPRRLDICSEDGPAAILSASLPKDLVVRGATALHQPRDTTPMVSLAFEGMCAIVAEDVVEDHDRAAFNPSDPVLALELVNTHLLGFPPGTEQHERNEDMLLRYFTALTASPVCAAPDAFGMALRSETPECGLGMNDEDALRDLWTMACQSPSMTGVGQ